MEGILIRPFQASDAESVVALWELCGLVVPWNNPYKDIERKMRIQPDLFLVATLGDRIVATVMAGYEGHRGWINYLATHPDLQRQGVAKRLLAEAEKELRLLGCPKINLQIRESNTGVRAFYESLGYIEDAAISLGKRLEDDTL